MSNFIDVNLFIKSLEVMGLGMLGIFIVIACYFAACCSTE